VTDRHRRHSATATIVVWGAVVVAADAILWALWETWPLVLSVGAAGVAVVWWRRHRGNKTLPPRPIPPLRLVASNPDADPDSIDQAELVRLRRDNAKLRRKVAVLAEYINGPEVRP
jgi:hypothetical protein